MITPNDLQLALYDLARTIPLSGVNDDGQIYAYEHNGTARVIVLAVNALAKIREMETCNKPNDDSVNASFPCDTCRFNPPSSCDGKPCTMCDTSNPLTNCYQKAEGEE